MKCCLYKITLVKYLRWKFFSLKYSTITHIGWICDICTLPYPDIFPNVVCVQIIVPADVRKWKLEMSNVPFKCIKRILGLAKYLNIYTIYTKVLLNIIWILSMLRIITHIMTQSNHVEYTSKTTLIWSPICFCSLVRYYFFK